MPNTIENPDHAAKEEQLPYEEIPPEELSTEKIAEACNDVLDAETCDEIGAQSSPQEAIYLAFAALIEAGIEHPDDFFRQKGITLEDSAE